MKNRAYVEERINSTEGRLDLTEKTEDMERGENKVLGLGILTSKLWLIEKHVVSSYDQN